MAWFGVKLKFMFQRPFCNVDGDVHLTPATAYAHTLMKIPRTPKKEDKCLN